MGWKHQISSRISGFVNSLPTNSGHPLILGNFNINWDCQRNANTRDDDNLIKSVNVSSMLSGHFLININVSLQKQSVSAKVISYRRHKSIDNEAFLADLWVPSLVLDPPDDVDHLVNLYDNTLRDIVDQHAPLTKFKDKGNAKQTNASMV